MTRKPRSEAAAPAADAGPTPETAAKLRRDLVQRLAGEGRLGREQVRAAFEVRRIWEAFGRGLFPATNTMAAAAARGRPTIHEFFRRWGNAGPTKRKTWMVGLRRP